MSATRDELIHSMAVLYAAALYSGQFAPNRVRAAIENVTDLLDMPSDWLPDAKPGDLIETIEAKLKAALA